MLQFALYYSKSLAVSSYDPGVKYIQRISHRFATVCTLHKTSQFCIRNPPLCVELEQLTGTPPHLYCMRAVCELTTKKSTCRILPSPQLSSLESAKWVKIPCPEHIFATQMSERVIRERDIYIYIYILHCWLRICVRRMLSNRSFGPPQR